MKTSNYLLDYYKATNSKREEHRKKCFEQVHNLHIYNYIAIQRKRSGKGNGFNSRTQYKES